MFVILFLNFNHFYRNVDRKTIIPKISFKSVAFMKCLLNTNILIIMTKNLLGSCLLHNGIESHQIIKSFG